MSARVRVCVEPACLPARLPACSYAVRRVLFSPHAETLLASCSYDMTVKLWDIHNPQAPLLRSWGHHTEFAVGLDFNVLKEGVMASAGWDEQVAVWHQNDQP